MQLRKNWKNIQDTPCSQSREWDATQKELKAHSAGRGSARDVDAMQLRKNWKSVSVVKYFFKSRSLQDATQKELKAAVRPVLFLDKSGSRCNSERIESQVSVNKNV